MTSKLSMVSEAEKSLMPWRSDRERLMFANVLIGAMTNRISSNDLAASIEAASRYVSYERKRKDEEQ